MDRLIIMDKGHIVEDGSHEQLLRKGGLYANLWARQSGGFLFEEKTSAPSQVDRDVYTKVQVAGE